MMDEWIRVLQVIIRSNSLIIFSMKNPTKSMSLVWWQPHIGLPRPCLPNCCSLDKKNPFSAWCHSIKGVYHLFNLRQLKVIDLDC